MSDDLDLSKALECDVVIAGAGLAGLVAGAILSRHGRHVVVVDGEDLIGGRTGSAPHRGYWLDGGLRDGRDVGDLQVGWRYGQLAAEEAGVEVPLRLVEPKVRVHQLPDRQGTGTPSVSLGSWGAGGFIKMALDVFGCPEDLLPDFIEVLTKLASAPKADQKNAIPLLLGDWLTREVADPAVRRAILTMTKVIYCEYPEQASVGRLMSFFSRSEGLPDVQTAYPDHPTVGGIQGLIVPFSEAIEARGGRILTGFAPLRVLFDEERATGLVAINKAQLVLEIRAKQTIIAHPIWQALELLPKARVDESLALLSRDLERASGDAICWQAGLRRVPRVRSTGVTDDHIGWNRVLIGSDRRYNGGFHMPSLGCRSSAPGDAHLLHAFVGRWLSGDPDDNWTGMRGKVDRIIDYLRDYYIDLDDCLIWSAHQYLSSPAFLSWYWSPVERHGARVPGCTSLYFASTTMESDAGPIDISAHAGLTAAREILQS